MGYSEASRNSVRAAGPADRRDGLEQVLDILEDAVPADVQEFEADPLVQGQILRPYRYGGA
jgi:hypothetical protein